MAKIHAPNTQYDGESASVKFRQGVGETSDPLLLSWFKDHGYTVEDEVDPNADAEKIADLKAYAAKYGFDIGTASEAEEIEKVLQEATEQKIAELKAYASEHGIDLGKATTLDGITKKIADAEQGGK